MQHPARENPCGRIWMAALPAVLLLASTASAQQHQPAEELEQPAEERVQATEERVQPIQERVEPMEERAQPAEERVQPAEERSPAKLLPAGITLKDLSGSWSGSLVAPQPMGKIQILYARFDAQGLPYEAADSLGHEWTRAQALSDATLSQSGHIHVRMRRVDGGSEVLELSGSVSSAGTRFQGQYFLISDATARDANNKVDPQPFEEDPRREEQRNSIDPTSYGGWIPDHYPRPEPWMPKNESFEDSDEPLRVSASVVAASGRFELTKWQGASAPEEDLSGSVSGGAEGPPGKFKAGASLVGLVREEKQKANASQR